MKKVAQNIALTAMFLLGLSLLLYPTISNWWNSSHQSRAVASYTEVVASMDKSKYEAKWQDAVNYNKNIATLQKSAVFLSEEQKAAYARQLKVEDTEVMGYVEIPIIDCVLPMYHGTREEELQVGVGHLEWTSLPVGGESTHSVISGHRGVPSAKLLSNLDKVVEGDYFVLHVLDKSLTYQVDQIHIVEPDDIDFLYIEEGEDLCTLVTCTPYGINSHRLLVRGHRVDDSLVPELKVASDATQIDPYLVALVLGVFIFFGMIIFVFISDKIREKKDRKEVHSEKL